ncbi:MAG: RIP metalloprotease RseP [Smithellaceae bacterium]|nr:RIP metalloprotease RseP [Smithellaceae bacterium]
MIGISILSLVILLGVLIFVHELGHFLMAKQLGVGVLKFSLGFGPRIIGKQVGETQYQISLIPLGGYVKLLGESEGEELSPADQSRSFQKQSVYRRFAIVMAGPIFNFLLAIFIFSLVNMTGLPYLTSRLGGVAEGSPASSAGLQDGDIIEAISGVSINRWDKMADMISKSQGRELHLIVRRGEQTREVRIVPRGEKGKNLFGEEIDVYRIGVKPTSEIVTQAMNPFDATTHAFVQTTNIAKLTVLSLVKMFQGVVSPKTLGGPILIAQLAGSQVKEGLIPFVMFMALLSINLAILNLLPIPVLDGGHLMFFLIEMIRGKEVSLVWRERAQQVGLAIIIMLMVFVFIIDIERLNLNIFR